MKTAKHILPIIVFAQFCCTSLWFAGNAIVDDLIFSYSLNSNVLNGLTTAIQLGFIAGTLVFAVLTIADQFSPSKVFFTSALFGALCNLGLLYDGNSIISLLTFRFLTGFFLAGIYPVGMKIASDYFKKGLGKSLSFLVAALVLGTAFPHILKSYPNLIDWQMVIYSTSGLTVLGGVLIYCFVPNGPYQKLASTFDIKTIFKVFKISEFKKASFGYFGHMWELYAYWAFVPILLKFYAKQHSIVINIPLWSFVIIAVGAVGCVLGGFLSEKIGTKKTAVGSLIISGLCCVLSPLVLFQSSELLLFTFLLIWGVSVIADSPLFSTLIAQSVSRDSKGTALTISTCIGFAFTILSIKLLSYLTGNFNTVWVYTILAVGPFLSLIYLYKKS